MVGIHGQSSCIGQSTDYIRSLQDGIREEIHSGYSPRQEGYRICATHLGQMMVSEYEVKFFELSRYALQIICTEREKARKYQEGLAPYIKSRMAPFMIVKYEKFTRRL